MPRNNKVEIYLHLVWGTWDRLPLLDFMWKDELHRILISEAHKLDCRTLAINSMSDHVHQLVAFPSTCTVAYLVQQLKGVSSRIINRRFKPDFEFRWEGYYGVFSVSRSHLDMVERYIQNQEQHHARNTVIDRLEQTFEN